MIKILYSAKIRDGRLADTVEFEIEVDDDQTDDEIEEIVRDHIVTNKLEWTWRRA